MRLIAMLRTAAPAIAISLGAATGTAIAETQSYTTEFDGTESPLSEGGAWSHVGLDWTKVQKANGIAFGTQTGSNGYDDSYAVLSGFGPNQSASAKVHLGSSIDASCSHEVEILLRWSDSDHSARGYEINLSFDGGYAQIVRWNGGLGNFTVLGGGGYPGLMNGDTFAASIEGDLIKMSVNGNPIAQVRDSTFTTGNPGVGFFRRACGTNADVGFQSFTATGSDGALVPGPNPPTNLRVSP
jgi:hypothetical protein